MSKQKQAISAILAAVCEHPAVRAVFLKGSLATSNGDQYSDVDFYCLVDENKQAGFLQDRLPILANYKPVVYWSEQNFVGPQIVAVFADGLHFDLYTVTETNFPRQGQFKVLYDPENILARFSSQGIFPFQPDKLKNGSMSSASASWNSKPRGSGAIFAGPRAWPAI